MNRFDAVLFDLDGTLLYTLSDIAAAVNGALREMHRPERTVTEIRSMVGNGAKMLITRALYVGDSGVDSETAKNASLPCVLCDWGYWDRDRLENCAALGVISAPAELLQYV